MEGVATQFEEVMVTEALGAGEQAADFRLQETQFRREILSAIRHVNRGDRQITDLCEDDPVLNIKRWV